MKVKGRLAKCCVAILGLILSLLIVPAQAGSLEQAKRIHDRLAGVPPTESVLRQMQSSIDSTGAGLDAAAIAMENENFYRVTLKNWAAPWTNRDQSVFVPLNDYIATVIGLIRDDEDFRTVLYDDVLYTASGVTPPYSPRNNSHYDALEKGRDSNGQPYSFKDRLQSAVQSQHTGLPSEATAGVLTSRAAARAFFIAGTNRAQLRFTLINHLCRDLEQVQDNTGIPDRIRQDVSRSPGGDARAFLNGCVGCHAGMDPLAQAFAYYNFDYDAENDLTGEDGQLVYHTTIQPETGTRVDPKYHINSSTFPYGYATPDDRWDNYWRQGMNAQLEWDQSLPGRGQGARSLGQELAHSQAFAECQVTKVFRAVCLREPGDAADRGQVQYMTQRFAFNGYRMKPVFADAADYCKGP